MGRADRRTQELDVVGFLVPEWTALAGGLRPEPREPEHHEPGAQRAGWQHEAASCITPLSRNVHLASPQPNATGHVEIAERPSRNSIFDDPFILFDTVGTCSPPGPSPTSPFPSCPLDKRICRCGRLLDAFGHHRAACSRSGVLGEKGASRWKVQLPECAERQGSAWATNFFVRDMDLGVPNAYDDVWRLWPTVCHSWVQFKVTANRRGELLTGMVWHSNRRAGGKKQHTLNSCSQVAGRAWWLWLWRWRGRWSQEARTFVQLLAEARTRSEPLLMRRRMEQARRRWFSILSLEQTPTTEVEFDELIDFYFCRIL